jgi:hypothetical protein
MTEIKKVVRNGKVAVLYSPGFGAGWYSWARNNNQQIVFSPELVEAVERGDSYDQKTKLAESLFPGEYSGGAGQLKIEWVSEGTQFEIHEYDGSETIQFADRDWLMA